MKKILNIIFAICLSSLVLSEIKSPYENSIEYSYNFDDMPNYYEQKLVPQENEVQEKVEHEVQEDAPPDVLSIKDIPQDDSSYPEETGEYYDEEGNYIGLYDEKTGDYYDKTGEYLGRYDSQNGSYYNKLGEYLGQYDKENGEYSNQDGKYIGRFDKTLNVYYDRDENVIKRSMLIKKLEGVSQEY